MSVNNQIHSQLQQELQNELNTTNQLLFQISQVVKQIEEYTKANGQFAINIEEVATQMANLKKKVQGNKRIKNIIPMNKFDNLRLAQNTTEDSMQDTTDQ